MLSQKASSNSWGGKEFLSFTTDIHDRGVYLMTSFTIIIRNISVYLITRLSPLP
jgi:hypothetical protein